jgi:hypothetical protein
MKSTIISNKLQPLDFGKVVVVVGIVAITDDIDFVVSHYRILEELNQDAYQILRTLSGWMI